MIVNDDRDMFIVQATMGMIVNYKCNTFIVQSDAFSVTKVKSLWHQVEGDKDIDGQIYRNSVMR
jgi:hypothetical protein